MPQDNRARLAVNIDPHTAAQFKQAAANKGLSVNQALKLAVYQSLGKGPADDVTDLPAWLRGK